MKTKVLIAIICVGVTTLFAQNTPSYVPKNGLVGWWPFNGNANDESGNRNNGVVNGATLTTDRNGKTNSAYSFSGVKSSNIVLGNIALKNNFSISIWAKANRNSQKTNISTLCYPSSTTIQNQNWLILPPHGGNGLSLGVGIVFGNDRIMVAEHCSNLLVSRATSEAIRNDFTHIVLNYTNSDFELYINNIKVISQKVNCSSIPKILGSTLGTSYFSPEFLGIIDDVAMYNRALTSEEITLLFSGCSKETASLNSTNSLILKNSNPISLVANPSGGTFVGATIVKGKFTPSKAKLGSNPIQYLFTNSKGCSDTTRFNIMVYDTIGNVCSTTDTLKINLKLTTGIKANQFTDIKVYPNPTSDVLYISAFDIDALNGYSYNIIDVQGKIIYNKLIQNSLTQIPLNTLGGKGTYILFILDASGTKIESKHIVLQ